MSKPIYEIPKEYEGKLDLERSQSVRSCADCSNCLDIHQLNDGSGLLLVNETQRMIISVDDFKGLQALKL